MTGKTKCLVIGIGNRFRSDDAVGIVVAAELRKLKLPPHIEIIEGGTDEFGLIEHFKTAEHVVIIDAVSTGKPPGTINTFASVDVEMLINTGQLAVHEFGLADAIVLARALGVFPKITIVGVEPLSTGFGERLSSLVTSIIPAVVQAVLRVFDQACLKRTCESRLSKIAGSRTMNPIRNSDS